MFISFRKLVNTPKSELFLLAGSPLVFIALWLFAGVIHAGDSGSYIDEHNRPARRPGA